MAYSKIEQAYLDGLVQAQFPDPVEPEPTLLASADTGITTDGGAYVGTRLNMPKGLNTPENMQAVGNDIPKTVAGVAKGMAQGFVGLPGDLEGIGRLVLNYMGADVNEQTKLPTTQDVKGFLDQYIKLPELQTGDMSNFETAGEWLAPGGQLKAVKPVAKAIKGAVKMTEGLPVGLSTKAVGQGVDDLGFYSAAAKAVDAIQQPKGTGEQFLAQITKTPGVKQDEIIWTGLDDFLKSKKTVTKQEVQDYLANNRVDIKEVQLSDGGLKKKFSINSPEDQDFYDVIDKQGKVIFTGPEDEADYLLDRSLTKFSKYTLPGGENYREVLLTLPDNRKPPTFEQWLDNYTMMTLDQVNADPKLMEIAQNSYKTDVDKLPRVGGFKSNHFDQPNILAHLRVNDRVDADGKKVLMVEEVQSDWHQAGRKKGYNTPEQKAENQKKLDALDAERSNLEAEKARLEELAKPYTDQGKDAPSDILDKWNQTANRLNNLQREYAPIANLMATGSGVPNAPFKNNWQELAMKRAIQMAAEGGYERIAFTTGKTQAARYDLSKQVKMISAMPDKNGAYNIYIEGKDGDAAFRNQNGFSEYGQKTVTPEEFEELVGKDVAKTIMQKADELNRGKVSKEQFKFYDSRPEDLTIGGEGMKGFYDNILPKFLDKYAKKWDAKTGMSEIKAGDKNEPVHYIDITPKMRESVVTKGQPMFAIGAGGAGAATQQNQEKK